jgi:hypothetical protein
VVAVIAVVVVVVAAAAAVTANSYYGNGEHLEEHTNVKLRLNFN